ncbi:MAG: protein kinase [Armatimonadetes bacterium]|nr:protein kinase [Armatimonadota bacterium]MDE2206015.1 protein kinase [Armatimonadota bacterium]
MTTGPVSQSLGCESLCACIQALHQTEYGVADLFRGKYRIIRELARSNDIVYEGLDVTLGRRIAIKELNIAPTLAGQARRDRIERFHREARAAGRLSHPNIVSVYDYGEEHGRYFIAMEFLDGQSLRERLQTQGAVPILDAIAIMRQVLDALQYAHAHRVVHRDIKPDNIQLLPGSHVKLTDFGIARLVEEPNMTNAGQVYGTPSYMSPEQITGGAIDARSDLFSAGVVLYEMLSGHKPFLGDSVVSITWSVMNSEPAQMRGVPGPLDSVARRAMSKPVEARYRSAEEMNAALNEAEAAISGRWLTPPVEPSMGHPGLPLPSTPFPMTSAPPPPITSGQTVLAFNAQPAARRRRKPLRLSPAARLILICLAAGAAIALLLSFGVLGVVNGYSEYAQSSLLTRARVAIQRGDSAYNEGRYTAAAKLFEKALREDPPQPDRSIVTANLYNTYLQLAMHADQAAQLDAAAGWCRKAIALNGAAANAHVEYARVLTELGQTSNADQERTQAGSQSGVSVPARVDESPSSDATGAVGDGYVEQQRLQAQQLIRAGDALQQQGDTDGARAKWLQAIALAPGTPERDAAQQRLDQTAGQEQIPQ